MRNIRLPALHGDKMHIEAREVTYDGNIEELTRRYSDDFRSFDYENTEMRQCRNAEVDRSVTFAISRHRANPEKILMMTALRRLKSQTLLEWEKDFVKNAEMRMQRGQLTEKQKLWLKRLKEKYLQK